MPRGVQGTLDREITAAITRLQVRTPANQPKPSLPAGRTRPQARGTLPTRRDSWTGKLTGKRKTKPSHSLRPHSQDHERCRLARRE